MPLHIVRSDITKMKVDAIVNTTNRDMVGFSGVDLAIHEAAGVGLDAECKKAAPLELGFAKITRGYDLDCKYIIHTSGPVWCGGDNGERALLKSCYTESLRLAQQFKCKSVAFPLISSGTYGYPKDQVLRHAVQTISEFLYENEMDVYLCVFDRQSYELSRSLMADLRSYLDNTVEAKGTDNISPHTCATVASDTLPIESNIRYMYEAKTMSAPVPERKKTRTEQLRDCLKSMDKGFAATLFDYIDASGVTDVECYKKANIDRRTFSKIKSNPQYKPSKQTAVAFALALRLDLENTQHLLATAGLTLSQSSTFDNIIRYFIQNEIYDVFEINEALFEFDQILLGC